MQRYQCHTIVEAAKILTIERLDDGAIQLELDDREILQQDDQWLDKLPPFTEPRPEVHRIEGGDLGYVVRDADGSESWSPTAAFEAGYAALVDDQVSMVVHRPPGHRLQLSFTADEPYERVRQQIERALGNFLQHAFFGTAADGNPNPVVPAEAVALVGFTADQLRELKAIATADPGTAEEIHNRWFHQKVTDGWHFGNTDTDARASSYLRVFHELAPGQQGLLVHELCHQGL